LDPPGIELVRTVKDNRVVTIFPGYGGGKTDDIIRIALPGDKFKTPR